MRCPSCGFENLVGEDSCANCGADLSALDAPESATSFEGRLLGEHLDALGIVPPVMIQSTESVPAALRQMREAGVDCLLVMSGDRLVGIFTERDAVLKVAGTRVDAFDVRDVMTRDPVVLRHDDTLAVAVHKMAIGGFRHIPLVDEGTPLGVVAAKDIFRHVLEVG